MPKPNNMLPFVKAIQVPTSPGDYLVITMDMIYVHVVARFIDDEFQSFYSKDRGQLRETVILYFCPMQPTSTVIKSLYENQQKPRLALCNA